MPFVAATWLGALLSGDRKCRWAFWFKAHNPGYAKLADTYDTTLDVWKEQQERMVTHRVDVLRSEGWDVFRDEQNRYRIRGLAAMVGGQPSIVAVRGAQAYVEDCQPGERKQTHYWTMQVHLQQGVRALSALFSPLLQAPFGAVVYAEPPALVLQAVEVTPATRVSVVQLVSDLARSDAPRHTPSVAECAACDIAACEARLSARLQEAETTEF